MNVIVLFAVFYIVDSGASANGYGKHVADQLDLNPNWERTCRWIDGKPIRLESIPIATQKLSRELRSLQPEDALKQIIGCWNEAESRFVTTRIERHGKPFGVDSEYACWHRVQGKGLVVRRGRSEEQATITNWVDWERSFAVSRLGESCSVSRDIENGFAPWGFTVTNMAFPLTKLRGNPHEWFDFKREGDVLLVARRHAKITRYWIDLNSLAVLGEVYGSEENFIVRRPAGYHYVDECPFPVASQFVESRHKGLDDEEPSASREITLKVAINKDLDQSIKIPPIPR